MAKPKKPAKSPTKKRTEKGPAKTKTSAKLRKPTKPTKPAPTGLCYEDAYRELIRGDGLIGGVLVQANIDGKHDTITSSHLVRWA